MSPLMFREAKEEDLPALADLWTALDRFHRDLGMDFPESDDSAETWTASFQRTLGRFSFVWVAEIEQGTAAFLLARLKQSPAFLGSVQVGEISDLYVDETLRGQGAGGELVKLAMEKFRELDVHSVEVQIMAGNEQGLEFWEKQGFRHDHTQVRKVIKQE